jgi:hypothetical protein
VTTNYGYNWRPVNILYRDEFVILAGEVEGKVDRQILRLCDADIAYRPILTPKEDREKAINEMVYGACGCEPDGGNTSMFIACGLLYDAGYRKESE